ncbi:MAG: AlwI family type II restriction endonuclease [Bacteroidales bacterium]|nr:AlwI family type II restriction endonuclease [Bacteroidales bacterium]
MRVETVLWSKETMRFWSVSTTVRNPERIRSFLKVLKELEGEVWNNATQKKYQILLLQRKVYGLNVPEFEKTLTKKHLEWLHSDAFTYKQAEEILNAKNYEGGGEMRGRQSFNPLEKMGLACLDTEKKIVITSFGKSFLLEDYDLGEIFFRSFLKWQYPNPDLNKYSATDGYNIKPLIATFHLIKKVNGLCIQNGIKEKGVSKIEFALFFTTLSNYTNIETTAGKIIHFRKNYETVKDTEPIEKFAEGYFYQNFSEYESWNNAKDYADNVIRYFRLTRFFYLRGNDYYIDLEPRRKIEIDSILEIDNAAAKTFSSQAEYATYLGDITQPELPWETKTKLQEVIKNILQEIDTETENLLGKNISIPQKPKFNAETGNINELKKIVELLRGYRRSLFDVETHTQLQRLENIEDCITSLKNIFKLADKKPVELERIITFGLHILNDAIGIRPNYPVGDDNQPTFTAPANKPDIECFYKSFNSICEVTLLSNRSQWFNEGQPVMRHFRDFETAHDEKQSYCLFVAPKIHRDTANTFWFSVKYEYEGRKQKIIPVTIQQFIEILQYLLQAKKQKSDYLLSHKKIQELFDAIISATGNISKSDDWLSAIPLLINKWGKSIAA